MQDLIPLLHVTPLLHGHRKRDVHLWSDEFLDARRYPEMRFESTSVQPSGPDKGFINGNLTLRGVTRPVRLAYQILGFGNDPWDGYRAGQGGEPGGPAQAAAAARHLQPRNLS